MIKKVNIRFNSVNSCMNNFCDFYRTLFCLMLLNSTLINGETVHYIYKYIRSITLYYKFCLRCLIYYKRWQISILQPIAKRSNFFRICR